MAGPVLLRTENLRRSFGRLAAVDGVDFEVPVGELRAVIGPNGAGKSTFFKLISGELVATAGRIVFDGRGITGLPHHVVSRRGIAKSYQITTVFPQLTVLENVRVAVQCRRTILDCWRAADRMRAVLNFEAGALSKSVTEGRVHPFLFGLDPHDLVGPIGQFQATRSSKDDVHKLVKALNSEAGIAAIGAHPLDLAFNTCWPDLERRLTALATEAARARPGRAEPALDLSDAARELLLAGVLDARGIVRRVRTSDQGLCVETNQRNFVESGNPRSEARWAAAVDELHDLRLLEDRAGRGEWFFVTDAGYHAVERLGSE